MKNFVQDLGLTFTTYDHQDLSGLHDAFDSHGVSLLRNILLGFKEAFICFYRTFCQIYTMCFFFECSTGFIESDMSVMSKTK